MTIDPQHLGPKTDAEKIVFDYEARIFDLEMQIAKLTRQTQEAVAAALMEAAELAWSEEEDRPWESWGEDRNVKVAQTVAKEISAAILALIPADAMQALEARDARVREAERERCAKVVEGWIGCEAIAAAIREGGK